MIIVKIELHSARTGKVSVRAISSAMGIAVSTWRRCSCRAFLILACAMGVLSGCRPDRAVLVKTWHRECFIMPAGLSSEIAKVETLGLCESIARAYNFARTADRPERLEEFGMCWDAYSYHCELYNY
jgi:hypothetical protein